MRGRRMAVGMLETAHVHAIAGAGVQYEAAGGAWRQQAALGGGAARSADALLCLVSRSTPLTCAVQVPKKPTRLWLAGCTGVQSAAEINFMITDRSISVRVPDRYRLVGRWPAGHRAAGPRLAARPAQELPLGLPVVQDPQSVKFVRKKAMLRVINHLSGADMAQPVSMSIVRVPPDNPGL